MRRNIDGEICLLFILAGNLCNPNPCIQGSCAEVLIGSALAPYCTCVNGWTGKLCDVDINGRYLDSCKINCLIFNLGLCPAGYCMSGGTCLLSGNVPYCQCLPSYTGTRCETLVTGVTTTAPPGK